MANRKTLGDYLKSTGKKVCTFTLPRTNIAPENWPSKKEIHLPTINFQGLCRNFGGVRRQNFGGDHGNIFHGGTKRWVVSKITKSFSCRVLEGGCSRGGSNWEDWGTLGNSREDWGNHHPPFRILLFRCPT